jgi:hypothetical protein
MLFLECLEWRLVAGEDAIEVSEIIWTRLELAGSRDEYTSDAYRSCCPCRPVEPSAPQYKSESPRR